MALGDDEWTPTQSRVDVQGGQASLPSQENKKEVLRVGSSEIRGRNLCALFRFLLVASSLLKASVCDNAEIPRP